MSVLALALAGCAGYDGPRFDGVWATAPDDATAPGLRIEVVHDPSAWLQATVRAALFDAAGRRWVLEGEPRREGALGLVSARAPLRLGLGGALVLRRPGQGGDGAGAAPVTSGAAHAGAGSAGAGPAALERGPLGWALLRGRDAAGRDALWLDVGPLGRFAWSDTPYAEWVRLTFLRADDHAPGPPQADDPSGVGSTSAPGAAAPASGAVDADRAGAGLAEPIPADGAAPCPGCADAPDPAWRYCPTCGRALGAPGLR